MRQQPEGLRRGFGNRELSISGGAGSQGVVQQGNHELHGESARDWREPRARHSALLIKCARAR